jgi:hypothetical protein
MDGNFELLLSWSCCIPQNLLLNRTTGVVVVHQILDMNVIEIGKTHPDMNGSRNQGLIVRLVIKSARLSRNKSESLL